MESCDRAAQLTLLAAENSGVELPVACQDPEGNSLSGGLWLLHQCLSKVVTGNKAHRWLGYGQALLVVHGAITLEQAKMANKQASEEEGATEPRTLNLATVDYGFGQARLWGNFSREEVEKKFYHYANQCFGIRKSIAGCTLMSFEEGVNLPEVFGVAPEKMAVVLKHNGDTIVWDDKDKKIKTEFD